MPALTDTERTSLAAAIDAEAKRVGESLKAGVLWLQEIILRGDDARHIEKHMVACEKAFGLDLTGEKLAVNLG